MAHFEVDSFVTKFKYLCHAGFKATLAITASDGEASVVLTASLGPIPPTPLHDVRHHGQPSRPHRGPAYHRRQERREAARVAAEKAPEEVDVNSAAEAGETSEAEQVETNDETLEDTKDKSAEQARINFPCLICDFASNWGNGLLIHMTRKHTNIEQFDGNGTFLDDDLKDDEKYSETRRYWETGRLGSAYQAFIDANHIIEKSNLPEDVKESEKAKILDSRKSAFGPNFTHVPPWNQKL